MSAAEDLDQLYEQQIKPLDRRARLQILARIAQDLAQAPDEPVTHSIMELHGVGAKIWRGVDAQAYINALRDEWNQPR